MSLQEPITIETPPKIPTAPVILPPTDQPTPPNPSTLHPIATLPPPHQQTIRSGRKLTRQNLDINIATSYGVSVDIRDPSHIRIFFQNIKGLTYSATGQDYEYYTSCIANIDADITGMAETNSAWQHHHLKSKFQTSIKKHFPMTKIAYSSPSVAIDPMPEKES